MRRVLLLLVAAASLSAADPEVRVVGVRVDADFPGKTADFQPFNGDTGTAVHLLVTGTGLVAADLDGSRLTAFADDKGRDLLGPATHPTGGFAPFPKVADDGSAALIGVRTREVPGPGATAISVAGTLRLRSGGAKAVTETKAIPLAKGSAIAWGADKKLTVERLEGTTLTVKTDDDLDDLVSLAFVDGEGKEHAAERRSSSSFAIEGKRSTTIDYEVDGAQPTMDARATWWRDLKHVDVPFTVVATLAAR